MRKMGRFIGHVLARVADDEVQLPNKSLPGRPPLYSKIHCLNNIVEV